MISLVLKKGNEVLKMEADLLKAQCGEGSVYGRTGGDKFAICIPKEEFKEQDFMDAIQTMGHAFNNDLYHLHIYVGVYEITDRNEEVSIMCDKANLAIKTLGENYDKSIAYYSDTIFHDTVAEKQLVGDFDKALAEKQFCIYLQPQVTSEGKLLGAEALIQVTVAVNTCRTVFRQVLYQNHPPAAFRQRYHEISCRYSMQLIYHSFPPVSLLQDWLYHT